MTAYPSPAPFNRTHTPIEPREYSIQRTGINANLPVADLAEARHSYVDYLGLSVGGFNLGWVECSSVSMVFGLKLTPATRP